MSGFKVVVIYPRPKDIDVFESAFTKEHVPLAIEKLKGKTKFVATRVIGSPQGTTPVHRIAEIHFPSRQALDACLSSEDAKQTVAHAVSISTGGQPIFLIAEEEAFHFDAGRTT